MKTQHSLIALAILGLGSATQAAPLTPTQAADATAAGNAIYVSGSSALRFSLASGFVSMCQAGTITVFGNTNGSAASGNNVRGYACTLAKDIKPKSGGATAFLAGTNVVFNKYDAGGSINGIQPLVKNTALPYMTYSAAGCTATGNARSGTFDLTIVDYSCPQNSNVVPQMGVSDVEAATIQNKLNLATGTTAVATNTLTGGVHSVAMAGVAVNLPLYRALQAAQSLTLDDAEANAPSLPVAFLAAVETGNASPLVGTGFNALIPSDGSNSASDSAAEAVTYCTRANGSGTKAMHNAFLLSTPCSNQGLTPAGTASPNASVTEIGNNDAVLNVQTSTGNVIACLGGAAADNSKTTGGQFKKWAIGIVGSENDPAASGTLDNAWRFVKVSGTYPSQANGQSGAYPMTYENYMYWPSSGLASKYSQFAKWLQTDAVTPLALAATPDAGTRKGILSIADITDPAYSGVTNYVARASRQGSSCKPQVLVQ
ncbi:hypothetical protein SNE35_02370 [Paucibacter sp. R3-3]|uniref:PBP domain-containing protein n=1 Tax=Roseateles agri TaxID=3098619 RepID=A0ABU5DAQ9_9BURK|nr:hypothetical protein [Paucibacter sp. R3-3]MDY0743329.1 hypothetical protein [Paucibacter sp. R3-3]